MDVVAGGEREQLNGKIWNEAEKKAGEGGKETACKGT